MTAGGLWKRSRGAIGFSSKNSNWDTPQDFFDKLNKKFNFTLDPCATKTSTKCTKYYTEQENGLVQNWGGHQVFINPPYGRDIGKWIQKGHEESKKHNTLVVMLLPSRTDTKWWHHYVMKAKEIHFVKGRLKFGGSDTAAPFPSAVVVFHSDTMLRSEPTLLPRIYHMGRK